MINISLKEQIDVALFAGQLLSESGAQYDVVINSVHSLANALGCDNIEIMVMPTTIVLTVTDGNEFRTRIRNVSPIIPDMQKLSAIVKLCKESEEFGITLATAIHRLEEIADAKPLYSHKTVALGAGIACGGFALIFHGGLAAFIITAFAAWLAYWVRYGLLEAKFHWIVIAAISAFVATITPSFFGFFINSTEIDTAQAASVLFLVPGILFIHSVEDMLVGYFVVGAARGIHAIILCLGIVSGMAAALGLERLWS